MLLYAIFFSGCKNPREPFRHWLPGVFPCTRIMELSLMVSRGFRDHFTGITPRDLAEGGKRVGWLCFVGTCGGGIRRRRMVLFRLKTGERNSGFRKKGVNRKTACCGGGGKQKSLLFLLRHVSFVRFVFYGVSYFFPALLSANRVKPLPAR